MVWIELHNDWMVWIELHKKNDVETGCAYQESFTISRSWKKKKNKNFAVFLQSLVFFPILKATVYLFEIELWIHIKANNFTVIFANNPMFFVNKFSMPVSLFFSCSEEMKGGYVRKEFYLLFVPRKSLLCEKKLKVSRWYQFLYCIL